MFNYKIFIIILLFPFAVFPDEKLKNIVVMDLDPLYGHAAVKLSDGEMKVLKIGDIISETKITVTQVLADRLVLEDQVNTKNKMVIKQIVWVYKAENGKSRILRLDKQKPESVSLPSSKTITEKIEISK